MYKTKINFCRSSKAENGEIFDWSINPSLNKESKFRFGNQIYSQLFYEEVGWNW